MTFQKIDQDSPNTITSAIDFFTIPPTNTSVSSSSWREILPLNPITDIPYRFRIHSSNNFLDLSKTYLLVEARIKKLDADNDWVNTVVTDNVAPINFIGQTFIRNVKVSLGGRELQDSNGLYMYKAYIDGELSLPVSVKDSYLSASGYYIDTDDQDNVLNSGFVIRKERAQNSQTMQYITKLDVDIFNQPNYMLNNLEIDIEIMPNDTNFCIQELPRTTTQYKFEIISLRMYVKALELMPSLSYEIAQKLEKTPARYAIRRSSTKAHYISEHRTEFSTMLWSDQVPRRIILGMVENSAYIGSKDKSPFNFKPFNTREITVFVNGRSYPSNIYNIDYTNNAFIRPYHEMMEALGYAYSPQSNGISLKKYKKGWCYYVFNLNNSQEENPTFDLITKGTTTTNIKFSDPVPAGGIVLISIAIFDSIIYIDGRKNVISDYNA
jgi:hypothetical protein